MSEVQIGEKSSATVMFPKLSTVDGREFFMSLLANSVIETAASFAAIPFPLPTWHCLLLFNVRKEDLGSNISSCKASQIGNISTVHWIWCPFYHHSYQYTFLLHRYYHGPTPIQSQQYATSQDIINSFHSIRQEMEAYVPNLTQVCKNFSEILFLMLASYFCTVSCLLATGV